MKCVCGKPGKILIKGVNYCAACVEQHLPEVRPIPLTMDNPASWWQLKPKKDDKAGNADKG